MNRTPAEYGTTEVTEDTEKEELNPQISQIDADSRGARAGGRLYLLPFLHNSAYTMRVCLWC
jgi:hypothetical protein